jgi:Icc-related predicted phosphoesterase
MLVLGDAHADDPGRRRALFAAYDAADADVAIQTGDLLTYELPIPTWFVAGNNEDFDVIERLRDGDTEGATNANLLASTVVELDGLRIAGLSGNYAPTQYEKSRGELAGDRRRHFVRDDVAAVTRLGDVDVLLAHEAPHGVLNTDGYDVGCRPIDELLGALSPTLCLVGHHHEHAEGTFGSTRVVTLAPAWESYYLLDPDGLALSRRTTPSH